MSKSLLFFADRLPPLIGGMEIHARYFIEHFTNHVQFPLAGIITKNSEGVDCLVTKEGLRSVEIQKLAERFDPAFVFFNSGRWIEELPQIRAVFPKAHFLYRTGGNEILKAPLIHQQIPDHSLRQAYWASIMNDTIDVMMTNSSYTEKRLREVGIKCFFKRCVGGVNAAALKQVEHHPQKEINIFCAARFVPYKNHSLLLSIIRKLILRGYPLQLRLAGDGPLLEQIKEQVVQENLSDVVSFLGVLDNKQVCQEMMRAHLYMQLSKDQVTEVPGGSYIHSEGMGRSILEALTAGTFVIATRSGALDEIITEGKGILINSDSIDCITDKIEQILQELPRRRPISDCYSWANVFMLYEDLLRGV